MHNSRTLISTTSSAFGLTTSLHLFFVVHAENIYPRLSATEIRLKVPHVVAGVLELTTHERVLPPSGIHDPSSYMSSPHPSLDNIRDWTGYGIEQEAGRWRRIAVRSLYCFSSPSHLNSPFFRLVELILTILAFPRSPKANDLAVTDSAADTGALPMTGNRLNASLEDRAGTPNSNSTAM